MSSRLIRAFEAGELNELFRDALPPTTDDVSIATDGRRLDTADKVVQFFAAPEAEWSTEHSCGATAPAAE